MLVFASFIPISHLVFIKSQKVKRYVGIFSSVLAFSLLVWAVAEKKEYLLGLPCAAFLIVYASKKVSEKIFDPIEFLGIIFGLSAMVTTKNHEVIALGLAADLLFVLTQKNYKKYFLIMATWLPLVLGYVLAPKTEFFDLFLAGTILLRAFDWPVRILPKEGAPRVQEFISRVVISVALWKTTEMLSPGFWIAFWMFLPLFFSWGGGERNLLLLTSLALWSISPTLGLYSVALWPLYFAEGRWALSLTALCCATGFIANGNISGLMEEALLALVFLQALAISRTEVRLVEEKSVQKSSQMMLLIAASLGVLATVYLMTAPMELKVTTAGIVFVALNVVFVAGGIVLWLKKKSRFFQNLPEIEVVDSTLSKIESTRYFSLKRSSKTEFFELLFMKKVFAYIETDAYLIILVALVAAVMFWGVL